MFGDSRYQVRDGVGVSAVDPPKLVLGNEATVVEILNTDGMSLEHDDTCRLSKGHQWKAMVNDW